MNTFTTEAFYAAAPKMLRPFFEAKKMDLNDSDLLVFLDYAQEMTMRVRGEDMDLQASLELLTETFQLHDEIRTFRVEHPKVSVWYSMNYNSIGAISRDLALPAIICRQRGATVEVVDSDPSDPDAHRYVVFAGNPNEPRRNRLWSRGIEKTASLPIVFLTASLSNSYLSRCGIPGRIERIDALLMALRLL